MRGSRMILIVSSALSFAVLALGCVASLQFDSISGVADLTILFGPAVLCSAGTVPVFMMSSIPSKKA